MEDMLIKLHHLPGCTIITRSYKALMDALDRDFWAHTFQSYLAEFETSLGDYTVENLSQLFEKVYVGQCEHSWDQLYKTFNHLWTCRSMYFYLKTTFFRHLPSSAPVLDLEQHVLHEMNLYERDVQIIQDAAEKITGGFFLSGLTSDKSWNLQLAYIPRFEDIDKTEQNLLMETTRGVIFGNAIVDKQKVYKHENSEFVRIQDISDNTEYIYRFKDNFVQPGIYRVLFPNGNTCIGYRYLPREGGIDQYYRLIRFPSGNIYYDHEIHRNSKWESITRFRFDHTNLSWKKIK